MNILAIETSATPSSVAVLNNGKILSSGYINNKLTHSQTLMPMVNMALNNASIKIEDIDYFAVASGPGSFTGVRIGIAAVKGLAFDKEFEKENKICISLSTIHSMAMLWKGMFFKGIVCPVMDARRNQVYTAVFRSDGKNIERITKDIAISIDDLSDILKENLKTDENIIFVGDGAELCYNSLTEVLPTVTLPPKTYRYQNAVGVGILAKENIQEAVTSSELMPTYLRLPEAERKLKKLD